MIWDVFISHASEDKEEVVRPLCKLLEARGLSVWLDEMQIELGDSLRKKLDEALMNSNFGVIILSPDFFKKDWTLRELGALQSKEFGSTKVILPIWHQISSSDIVKYSPMLADRIAAFTSEGLDKVAEKIIKVVKPGALHTIDSKKKYVDSFVISDTVIANAVDSIKALLNPKKWKTLAPIKDMTSPIEWMGTNESSFITIFYNLYLPLILFKHISYQLERSFSSFNTTNKIKQLILKLSYNILINEAKIAALRPSIAYSPRVYNWRIQRQKTPHAFWWQGISEEKLEGSIRFFIRNVYDETFSPEIYSLTEFKKTYDILYNGRSKDKQPLGLLANALYGFVPKDRPVYFRVLIGWQYLYQLYIALTKDDISITNNDELTSMLNSTHINIEENIDEKYLFEPMSNTIDTILSYLKKEIIEDSALCFKN